MKKRGFVVLIAFGLAAGLSAQQEQSNENLTEEETQEKEDQMLVKTVEGPLPGEDLDIDAPALSVTQQKLVPGVEKGKRRIEIIEDRNQTFMATKVYPLKYMTGADLTPFVLGAAKRFNANSKVERLNYKAKKQQYIVVTTGEQMIPYIDDMVAKLDRPGTKDDAGSIVDGDGIYRFVYYPKYRFNEEMIQIGEMLGSSDGRYFYDKSVNMIYWKDSQSDGKGVLKWMQVMDRPVPQVDLTVKIYEINDNDMKELGIDYISWKNGPGAELFGFGANIFKLQASEQVFSRAQEWITNIGSSWGGIMFAPQFDASFIRLLDQKGKARVYTSGSLTVANDFDGKYSISVSPGYQNITKNDTMEVSIDHDADSTFELTLVNPIICFNEEAEDAGTLMFDYDVDMRSVVERNNVGLEFVNRNEVSSSLTLACGNEKLLATFTREHDSEQYNGMPFLGDIPILKYLVGVDNHSKAYTRFCVTVEATPVRPEANLSPWAGELITAVEMLREDALRGKEQRAKRDTENYRDVQ